MGMPKVIIKEASSRFKLEELLQRVQGINSGNTVVQIFNPNFVISRAHLAGAYADSVLAFESNANISKGIATEMLLFAAMTRQINDAIRIMGARSAKHFILFASDKKAYMRMKDLLDKAKDYKENASRSHTIAKSFGLKAEKELDVLIMQKMAVSRL